MHQYQLIKKEIVKNCMKFVSKYPEEALGVAEAYATKGDLRLAIDSITKAVRDSDSRTTKHDQTEADMRSNLRQCFGIRKVKSF